MKDNFRFLLKLCFASSLVYMQFQLYLYFHVFTWFSFLFGIWFSGTTAIKFDRSAF